METFKFYTAQKKEFRDSCLDMEPITINKVRKEKLTPNTRLVCYSFLTSMELATVILCLSKKEKERVIKNHQVVDQEKIMSLSIGNYICAILNGRHERA